MPRGELKLIPGVDTTKTATLNEAALSVTNLTRLFADRSGLGLIQKLGGWVTYFGTAIGSTVRALKGWADLNGQNHLAIGALQSLSVLTNGNNPSITPQYAQTTPVPNVHTVAIGSPYVIITDTAFSPSINDFVEFLTPVSIGGIILNGVYDIIAETTTTYTINSNQLATSVADNTVPVTAGSFVVGTNYVISTLAGTTQAQWNTTAGTTASGVTYAIGSYFNAATVGAGTGQAVLAVLPAFVVTYQSSQVKVLFNNHGYQAGNTFYAAIPTTVGGITITGDYTVLSNPLPGTNYFYINAANLGTTTITNMGSFVVGNTYVITTTGTGFTAIGATSNAVGTKFTATGAGSGAGAAAIYQATAPMNGGLMSTFFYVVQGAQQTSTGFGVGGFGVGGFGSGTASIPSNGTPITATDWTLDNWGQILLACPYDGAIYYYDPTGAFNTAQILGSQAPTSNTGMFVAMPQRQVVAYGSSFTSQIDPLLIRWSDIEDFTTWIGTSTNQAGSYRIPTGSAIIAGIQAAQQGLFWTDLDMWAMQYIGLPYVYGFNKIGSNCGAISRKCVGILSGAVYWMSQKQFFVTRGQGPELMSCPVWDVIFQNLNEPYSENIRCAVNSQFNEIVWYYPSMASTTGENDSYVKYSVETQQWDFGGAVASSTIPAARTAWIDQSVLGSPIGVGTDNYIYQHEMGNDAAVSGQTVAMPTSLQTGYFSVAQGDNLVFIDQIWPDMKWGFYDGYANGAPQYANPATVQLTFYSANYPGDTPVQHGPYTMTQTGSNYITTRIRARLISIKISSNELGTFWRLGDIRYRFTPDGRY